MSEKEKVFNDDYIPYIVKWGRLTNLLAVVISFGPIIVLAVGFKLLPEFSTIIAGAIAIWSAVAAFWFVEPISYYPILGIPGTYMSFLAGNISNLRLPCAAVAQESAGAAVLAALPETVRSAFDYILPALFGAIFANFAINRPKIGVIALGFAFIMTILMNRGYLSFLPGIPSYAAASPDMGRSALDAVELMDIMPMALCRHLLVFWLILTVPGELLLMECF